MNKANKPKTAKPKPKKTNKTVKPKPKVRIVKTKARVAPRLSLKSATASSPFLVGAISNPAAVPNLRISVSGDAVPTATALLHTNIAYSPDATLGTYSDVVGVGGSSIHVYRDSLRSMVMLMEHPGGSKAHLGPGTPPGSGSLMYTGYFHPDDLDLSKHITVPVTPVYFEAYPDTFQPHGPRLYLGKLSNFPTQRFIWMDRRTELVATLINNVSTDHLILSRLDNVDQMVMAMDLTTTSASTVFAIEQEGYYALSFHALSAQTGRRIESLVLRNTLDDVPNQKYFGDCWGHVSSPGVENFLTCLQKCRVNATSILITPITNVLNINGFIHGVTSVVNHDFIRYSRPNLIKDTSGAADFLWTRRNAKNGCYAFLKPAGLADLAWLTEVKYDNVKSLTDVFFSLDQGVNSIHFHISTSGQAPNAPGLPSIAPGQNWEVTLIQSVEWQPLDSGQWIETHLPPVGSGTNLTNDALDHLKYIETFHDNPIHLADLKSGIKRVYSFTRANRGALARALSVLFPAYSGAFHAGAGFLGALPE